MIDHKGIIRALKKQTLPESFVAELVQAWQEPGLDWHVYNQWLVQTFRTRTDHLWRDARRYELAETN